MDRLGASLVLAMVLLAAPAWASQLIEVRVGTHPTYTRVVFELDALAGYRIERRNEAGVSEIVVTIDAASTPRSVVRKTVMVERVSVEQGDVRSVARIRLKHPPSRVKEMILTQPPRLVFDLVLPESQLAAIAARAAAKAAAQAAAGGVVAQAAADGAAAQAKPGGAAAQAKASGAATEAEQAKTREASRAAQQAKAREASRAAKQAKAREAARAAQQARARKAAHAAEQAKAREASRAAEQAEAREAEQAKVREAARAAEQAEAREAAQARAREAKPTKVAPVRKAKPTQDAPAREAKRPMPLPPPPPEGGSRLSGLDWGLVGGGGALVLLAATGFVLWLRRRSLPHDIDLTTLAEEAGAVDGGSDSADIFGWGEEPSAATDYEPAPTSTQGPSISAGPGRDDEYEKENEMDTDTRTIQTGPTGSEVPPVVGGAAGGDVARMLSELEGRVAQMEARLDEAVDARERLERQVAAQAEELRVQRAAIARTQRAVRSMKRGDEEQATEPAIREPSS